MATQLSDLYITISAKGIKEVTQQIETLRGRFDRVKAPAEEMEKGLAKTGTTSAGAGNALKSLGLNIPLTPLAGAAAVMGVVVAAAHKAIGAIESLKDTFIGLARQGFEGTVELYQYNFALQLLGREIAGALVPVLNLMTDAINTARRAIEGIGLTGQKAFAALLVGTVVLTAAISGLTLAVAALVIACSPVLIVFFGAAAAITAFIGALYLAYQSSAALRSSITTLRTAFGQLLTALEPFLVALAGLAQQVFQSFVVEPLIRFITYLTVAVKVLERMATLVAKVTGLSGLKFPGGEKTSVSLNQTGTESGEGTFQRIQQAILQLGTSTEEEKQTGLLQSIDNHLDYMQKFFEQSVLSKIPSNAGSLIEGAAGGAQDQFMNGFFGTGTRKLFGF